MKLLPAILVATLVISGCAEAEKKTAAPSPAKVAEEKPKKHPQRTYQLDDLETRELTLNGKKVTVWIADDQNKAAEGLMWLKDEDISKDQGMLFVFGDVRPRSFWMADTLIPLDVIFLNAAGRILNIERGEPQNTTDQLRSKRAAKYVLELKAGVAKELGLKEEQSLEIPPILYRGQL